MFLLANNQRDRESKDLNLVLVVELMDVYGVKDKEGCLKKILNLEAEIGGE